MNVRRLALVAGCLAFFGGAAVLVGAIPTDTSAAVVVIVGVVAALASLNVLTKRHTVRRRSETPKPERRHHVPVPGANLRDAVDQFRTETAGFTARTERVLDGLRGAATATLTRFRGLPYDEAHRQIDRGSWTDDPAAAAFLSPSIDHPETTVRDRLASKLGREREFHAGVRRTATAVASIGYTGFDDREPPEALSTYDRGGENDGRTRTTTDDVSGVHERTARSTGHWTGVGLVALFAVGVGAALESPSVVLAGVVGMGYAGFSRAFEAPTPTVEFERTLDEDDPDPGDEVDVTLTVTNVGGSFLADLRIIDGVPAGLAVTDGSPRLATALRPGESTTIEYAVAARRGSHRFDPAIVSTRDLSRSREREFLVGTSTTLVAEPVMRPIPTGVPLRTAAASFSGRLTTPEAGSGTKFHSVREYRKNDPLNRIDWNRHARTGELATLEFHEERAARVLVLVDARKAAYLAAEPDEPHAVDRAVDAAGRIAATLLDRGDTVGLAAIGPLRDEGPKEGLTDSCWLAPASGHHHRAAFERLLATHPQFSTLPPETDTGWIPQLRSIRRRLSAETQIVLLTPLCDRGSVHIARRLDGRGHPVTVVSPDPTDERTTSQQLARVARRIRQFDLQRVGIPTVDWAPNQGIDEAFARTNAGEKR